MSANNQEFDNQDIVNVHEPESSRWPYLIIAMPLLASIAFALYAYVTTDSHQPCYCVQATDASDYALLPNETSGIQHHFKSMLDACKELDQDIDHGDGRTAGRVRWVICGGTACGKNWPELFALP